MERDNNEINNQYLEDDLNTSFYYDIDPMERLRTVIKRYRKLLIIFIILFSIYLLEESSFNNCVAATGHSECGLGTLCDQKCMPPFYFLISAISPIYSTIFVLVLTPIHIKDYFYWKRKVKEEKEANN